MKKFMLVIPFCLFTVFSFSLQKKDPLKDLKSILLQVKKPAKNNGVTKKNTDKPNPKQSNNVPSVHDDNGVGSISKDAVFIEADRFYIFNNGAAVIQRGRLSAMIDAKGKLLVPFGKYEFSSSNRYEANTGGLFNVTPEGEPGNYICLNAEGKEMKFPGFEFKKLTEDFQYAIFRNEKDQYLYVDKNNKKFILNTGLGQLFSEGIGFTYIYGKTPSESYEVPMNLDNKILTKKKYAGISPYSDGMAKVKVVNEFGEIKYGFIDNTGKEVIPAIYTAREPSDFKSGLAKVFPQDRTEFDYAYINKKGEVTIKHKRKSFSPFSYTGYAFYSGNPGSVMNTSGEIISNKDFLASYGIVTDKPGESFYFIEEGKDIFVDGHLRFFRPLRGEYNTSGFINLATHKGVGPAFQNPNNSYDLVFDPVSKLAYARRYLGRDAVRKEMWREGYINEEGVFVIVKKEAGKW